jgi:hypothetical protein
MYFLDDHLFGNARFATALFEGMSGMGRLWQAAGTVKTVLENPRVLEKAAASGPAEPLRREAQVRTILPSGRNWRRPTRFGLVVT